MLTRTPDTRDIENWGPVHRPRRPTSPERPTDPASAAFADAIASDHVVVHMPGGAWPIGESRWPISKLPLRHRPFT